MTNKKTRRTAPSCKQAAADSTLRGHGDAVEDGKWVTLVQALAVLFEHDLHPTTGTSRHTIDSYKTTFRLLLRFVQQNRPELSPSKTPLELFDPLGDVRK
jgi:hypothetical protein